MLAFSFQKNSLSLSLYIYIYIMLAFFIGGAKLDLEGLKNCEEHKYRVNIGVLTPSSAWSFHLFKHYQPA